MWNRHVSQARASAALGYCKICSCPGKVSEAYGHGITQHIQRRTSHLVKH